MQIDIQAQVAHALSKRAWRGGGEEKPAESDTRARGSVEPTCRIANLKVNAESAA